MSAGFTKGPWIVHPAVARVDCQQLSEKGGLLPVAQMLWPTDERSEDETEANASLIAAAPDMFVALEKALPHLPEFDRSIAERVIAKARGETPNDGSIPSDD